MIRIKTDSAEETRRTGRRLGELIETDAVIALTGGLGSGKTVFVKGIADGLGTIDGDDVTSPSFALIHEYPGRIFLFHIDLYRLERYAEIAGIGLEEILEKGGVAAIEWADRIDQKTLGDHIHVRLEIINDDSRFITLTGYGDRSLKILHRLGEE
ncbi:MAG: tRNA (adenosine(37)-N6)-threonylcarbamoyltransferase complex ATPase subunit type 1 TsaE [Thermodesulfobacteriota bacterium]